MAEAAGTFVVGFRYRITRVGTTNFVAIGAASNTLGVIFTATGVGTGDGEAALVFSAAQQRSTAAAQPTESELESKYTVPIELIRAEAQSNRGYTLLVTVGSLDNTEFTNFFQAVKGFTVNTVNAEFDVAPSPVRGEIRGTPVYKLISWSNLAVSTPGVTISRSAPTTQYNWVITGSGPTTLYWRDTGTAQASDWTGAVTEGTVTVTAGTATIARVLSPTATVGRTVKISVYLDPAGTQLLTESTVTTIAN
jgi:hypothetical protein